MFIRQTATRNKSTGGDLPSPVRDGKRVRQVTLFNLGRQFDVSPNDWPRLCARIDCILNVQPSLFTESVFFETMAQRYAARLIANSPRPEPGAQTDAQTSAKTAAQTTAQQVYAEVDVESLQLTKLRSVGAEHAGLAAMSWLGMNGTLKDIGFNAAQ